MKITEWKYIKLAFKWFKTLPAVVQKSTIFALMIIFIATCFIPVDGKPLFAFYVVGFVCIGLLYFCVWGLWYLATRIYEDFL